MPFWAYTDAQLYQRELEKIFYGEHWCYVGLEVEIPNVGDYKLSWVGERQVIMVRDRVAPKDRGVDTGVRVVENRCAHRGVRFCQQPQGNARSFVCPYHQWTYKLNGDLAGLPFKDGVKDGDCVNGGMPADFDIKQHGLAKLRVAVLHGLVFATFSDERRAACRTTWARRSCPGWTASSRAGSSRCWATTASAFRATGS